MGEIMRLDYHMHFEKGSYDETWVEGFFAAARKQNLDEIGISEHSHTFPEFRELYYNELILDDSPVGKYQQQWLKTNKFKYSIDNYFDFMKKLQRNHKVKIGIEVCNFHNQSAVDDILKAYPFDYVIGSVHYVGGWGYDFAEIKDEWNRRDLRDIYEQYTQEIENLAALGLYDVLGHPFNIRLFKIFPEFDVAPYLERAAAALAKANMIIDVNTGTLYRYPIAEISPYEEFMKVAAEYELPIIISSDAHKPEDCGNYCDEAIEYVKSFGYKKMLRFENRQRELVDIG